jgi:hypothetical protein
MTLSPFYRRTVPFAAVSVILGLVIRFWPEDAAGPAATAVASTESIPMAEKRLANLREIVATVPAKDEILRKVNAELALREKGLLVADTAAQAQAQLIQIIREVGKAENVEIRSTEGFALRPLGDAYGEASVSVGYECRVDQLVNMLAAIAMRPELVSTSELRVGAGNPKDKVIGVHLTISGVVPRKLVPERHS